MPPQVRLITVILASSIVVSSSATAQIPSLSQDVAPARTAIIVQVLTDGRAFLTDQALVRLRAFSGADTWTVTRNRSEARFDDVVPGSYEVEVSAAGYGTVVQRLEVQQSFGVDRVTVILKRDGSAPALIAPPTSGVPDDVRKDTQRGIEALKAGQFKDAEKYLNKACKRYPDNADLNYLRGILNVQKKDLGKAKEYLDKAIASDPRHVRSLTAMGRVLLAQKDAAGAITNLEKAVSIDPDQWMAHWLLANGYLRTAEYKKADESARSALRTGKGAASAARLPLGQALAYMGRFPEAIEELEGFLRDVPGSPMAPEITRMIADLKTAVAQGKTSTPDQAARTTSAVLAIAAPDPGLAAPPWGPPGVDDVKPPVARGVACPERRVIDGAAERLKELMGSLSRFEATEEVVHEDVNEIGKPLARETRRFSYVAAISEPRPGILRVDEYRNALSGTAKFPAGIATLGLPSLAFVFHPKSQDSFEFACEGLGQWNGQATWLVHFRQRENRPSHLLAYDLGQGMDPVDLKGRVWIAADTFRVMHLEAEAIRPVRAIRLLSHHVTIDYSPVMFGDKGVELWLPKKAELYFHFRGHRYYRRHTFDSFRLFSVNSAQKVAEPKTEPQQ